MKSITTRQQQVLDVIKGSFDRTGKAPTIVEMRAAMSINSNRGITVHLDALEKKGIIIRSKNKTRGIALAECPQ